jgi:two-component system sensor histidine kinase KdpD
MRRRLIAIVLPLFAVALLASVLRALDADLTVAVLCFVSLVVGCALLGPLAATVGVLAAFLATNYFFTSPRDSFSIDKSQDLVALLAFGLAAGVVCVTVTRVNLLRRRALASDREARLRLELTNRLASGEEPYRVVASAGDRLEELFAFEECRAELDAQERLTVVTVPGADALTPEDRSLFDAFVNGLAASLDRVRLSREARAARESADVEHARAGFLAAMTHNLRTPLASIGTAASVLLDADAGLGRAQEVELLETIRGETDRLERLVTKVLSLGRIQAGTVRPVRAPTEVEELIQAAAGETRLLGFGRVRLTGSWDVPPVLVDHALVEVALVNVLENALRYSGPDGPVEVESRVESGRVRVAVVDHGPGVPATDRERVFGRFERGDGVNDSVGAGIGLAITREFVQAHGGECWFEATPGGGATFVMTLPVARGSA